MLIHRLPKNQEIVFKPSHCPNCQKKLTIRNLIPIISYLYQKGTCANCKTPIKKRYLLVELISLTLSLSLFYLFGPTPLFIKTLLFSLCLVILFFTDLETFIIPNSISYLLIATGLLWNISSKTHIDSLKGILIGFTIFYSIGFLSKLYYKKDTLGGGDLKLIMGIGAYWGIKTVIIASYLSFLIGGIIGLTLILAKKKKKTDYVPFGPSIIIGTSLAIPYTNSIWTYYFG